MYTLMFMVCVHTCAVLRSHDSSDSDDSMSGTSSKTTSVGKYVCWLVVGW